MGGSTRPDPNEEPGAFAQIFAAEDFISPAERKRGYEQLARERAEEKQRKADARAIVTALPAKPPAAGSKHSKAWAAAAGGVALGHVMKQRGASRKRHDPTADDMLRAAGAVTLVALAAGWAAAKAKLAGEEGVAAARAAAKAKREEQDREAIKWGKAQGATTGMRREGRAARMRTRERQRRLGSGLHRLANLENALWTMPAIADLYESESLTWEDAAVAVERVAEAITGYLPEGWVVDTDRRVSWHGGHVPSEAATTKAEEERLGRWIDDNGGFTDSGIDLDSVVTVHNSWAQVVEDSGCDIANVVEWAVADMPRREDQPKPAEEKPEPTLGWGTGWNGETAGSDWAA